MSALLRFAAAVFLVGLPACDRTGGIDIDDTAETEGDDTAEPQGEGTDDSGDSGDSGVVADLSVSDVSADLHEEFASIVRVSWTQSGRGTLQVLYSFESDTWLATPERETGPGEHSQVVVGLPYEIGVKWKLVADSVEVDAGELATGQLPANLPTAELIVADDTKWLESGSYLLTSVNSNPCGWCSGEYWAVILDREGRTVWARETADNDWTLFATVARDGDHLLIDDATYWSSWDDGSDGVIHRTWLDEHIEEIATPGLHHAFVEMPDGTLVWGSQAHGQSSDHEALVYKHPDEDEDETVLWTCGDDWPNSGYCESNGLFYSEERDSFLYSFYTNDAIVEVDRASGESLWWAGGVSGGYEFSLEGSEFSWQHGISYTDSGTLLLSTESGGGWSDVSTMLREYEVDHDSRELQQVWSWDSEVYASTNGDAWRLDNGNSLHVVGSSGHVFEVTSEGETVWHLDYGDNHLLGRGEYIEDLYELVSPQD